MRAAFSCGAILLLLGAVGCSEKELMSGLDSRDSFEVLSVLSRAGIHGERKRDGAGKELRYSIFVDDSDFDGAATALHEEGLPRETDDVLEQLTQSTGIIPNPPGLAALRADYVLSRLLERQVSILPGVADVRINIRSHTTGITAGRLGEKPKATIVIRSDAPKGTVDPLAIKNLVLQAIPELSLDDVQISLVRSGSKTGGAASAEDSGARAEVTRLSPLWPEALFQTEVPEVSRKSLQIRMGVTLALSCLISLWAGAVIGGLRARWRHRRSDNV